MKIYTETVSCDVCGGDGVGTFQTAVAAWDADSTIAHRDPSICRAVLDARRRQLDRLLDEAKRAVV